MKKIYASLIIIMMFMTACQPTPEESVVRSKDKDLVQEVIDANEEGNEENLTEDRNVIQEQIEAINRHLSTEFQANERVKIVVDAAVEMPAYEKLPMVRVAPKNISQEQLEILIKEAAGDKQVYYRSTGGISKYSKEEIQELMFNLTVFSQNGNLASVLKERLDETMNFFEEELTLSIPMSEEKPYNGELRLLDNNKAYSSSTSLKAYLGKANAATFELVQSFNGTRSFLMFSNQEYGENYTSFEPYEGVDADKIEMSYEGVDADKIEMSYEECKLMAESLIRKLEGENTDFSVISSRIGYSIDTFAGYTKETSPQCYAFTFARVYNGAYAYPINYLCKQDNVNYSEVIETERLYLLIDNSGHM